MENINTRLILGMLILIAVFASGLFWISNQDNDQPITNTIQSTPTPTLPPATLTPTISATTTPQVSITPIVTMSVTPTTTARISVTPTTIPTNNQVKVFFSDTVKSEVDPTYAVWKGRVTNRSDQFDYVIEQLIAGPTTAEKGVGLFTPLKLTGESNCDDQDFLLTMDTDNKKATVKFCKTVDATTAQQFKQIRSLLYYGLTQFETMNKVVVLDAQDKCLGDTSGLDTCKQ